MDSRIPSSNLWNNEAFAEALLQHLAVATFVIDADHKVIFWNQACEALTGVSAEEVIGTKDHWKGFYPEERPCLADIVLDNTFDQSPGLYKKTRLATQIDGIAAETWTTSADGAKRFLEFEAGAICNEQGEIIAVIECLRDRTEKKVLYDDLIEAHKKVKLAELRSRINEQRFMLALSSSKGAIWEFNPQTEEIETIPSWEELLGFPKENDQDSKQFWLGQIHPDDREKLDAALQQLRNHKTDLVEVEYRIKNAQDEWRWYLSKVYPEGKKLFEESVVGTHTDISAQKETEQAIKEMAFYDPLTALPNRRLLLERLKEEIALTNRIGNTGALMFIDLDNFKEVNDELGHEAGDTLLVEVARRIKNTIRETDMAARLGGDEFIILLGQLDHDMSIAAKNSEQVARSILKEINKPVIISEHSASVSPSIGIALFPAEDDNPEAVLKQADAAMYQAKKTGKNSITFFHPAIQEASELRSTSEKALRKAMKNAELELFFQPQTDSQGALEGAEALIRWHHPTRGFLTAGEFIAISEESNLALDVGQWSLDASLRELSEWQRNEIAPLYLSINISRRYFFHPTFVTEVKKLLSKYKIDPAKLVFEVVEETLMHEIGAATSVINALQKLGIRILLDDFGKGFSSLERLQKLPVSLAKIDRGTVDSYKISGTKNPVVETILALGQAYDIEVIAEGIETTTQLEALKKLGCAHFQGNHFCRPITAEAFEMLLHRTKEKSTDIALH